MLEFLQHTGKDEEGGEDDDKGMVSDVEGVRSLGGREILSSFLEGHGEGEMVGMDVVMEVVVEVVVVEAVDVVRAGFFVFSRCGCLGDMMDVKVVIEVVVGVVALVLWRWSML